jgi:hypothetical protein
MQMDRIDRSTNTALLAPLRQHLFYFAGDPTANVNAF